ncbi:ketopantoate reductase PanE/ApbA C terminal-domain-containing protein [Mycena metata]|uniref:2-dehydropantoate 2-reductase n=1 Tax=Mycena metata TaxID=1033252 RepID=A0AAD7P1P6_9AGAR|nr:ketopantoate reductase PanE/ApbA C terminal-domain-containing protein [Mycena metata]
MLDVLIFGLGAVGSTYAYILQAGNQVRVSVVARSNAPAIKEKGLTFRSNKFGDHEGIRFHAVFSDCQEAANSGLSFSHVICANKSLLDFVPPMEEIIRPVIGSETVIVLIQNGIGQEELLHKAFPATTIMSSAVYTGARIVEPGVIQMFTRTDSLLIGVDWNLDIPRTRQQAHMDALAEIFVKSNASIIVKEDVRADRWVKLLWNSVWNSLTALTELRTRDFIKTSANAESVARSMFSEGINIAKAKSIAVPEDTLKTMMKQYKSLSGSNSSMLVDALNKKPMEIEAILGNLMREGMALDIPVPTLTVFVHF